MLFQEAVNPRDIVADAVYNFHPQYQHYTRHDATLPRDEVEAYYRHSTDNPDVLPGGGNSTDVRYQDQTLVVPAVTASGLSVNGETSSSTAVNPQTATQAGETVAAVMPGLSRAKLNEKAVLLPTV